MAALASFSEAFEGEIVLPGSAGYDAARIVWNGMIDRRPAVVARCDGVDDVIRAIRFGREQDLADRGPVGWSQRRRLLDLRRRHRDRPLSDAGCRASTPSGGRRR